MVSLTSNTTSAQCDWINENETLLQNLNEIEKHIMISYSPNSRQIAEDINKSLKEKYKTWINYEQSDKNGINGAFAVLALITSEYCQNENCKIECENAYRQGKCLIPIKVDNSYNPSKAKSILGSEIAAHIYVDFTQNPFENNIEKLFDRIQNRDRICRDTIEIERQKFRKNCIINKKNALLMLVFLLLLITVCVIIVIIYNKLKIIPTEKARLKYCLITSMNEYIYYNGAGKWCYDDAIDSSVCYQEVKRDSEGIVISNRNETIRLSELSHTFTEPQPKWKNAKWSKVWVKLDASNQYIYAKSNDTLIELQNNIFYSYHKIKYIKDDEYYIVKSDNAHFKIDKTGLLLFGNSFNDNIKGFFPGVWENNYY